MNTKWRFYKFRHLRVFAALLKDVPKGCRNAVLPKPMLKNQTVGCLTCEEDTGQLYNDNMCFFCAPAFPLNENQRLEKNFKKFSLFIIGRDGLSLTESIS